MSSPYRVNRPERPYEAGIDMWPYASVGAWLERVRSQPRYMNDLEPYPPNAASRAGRSLYD